MESGVFGSSGRTGGNKDGRREDEEGVRLADTKVSKMFKSL